MDDLRSPQMNDMMFRKVTVVPPLHAPLPHFPSPGQLADNLWREMMQFCDEQGEEAANWVHGFRNPAGVRSIRGRLLNPKAYETMPFSPIKGEVVLVRHYDIKEAGMIFMLSPEGALAFFVVELKTGKLTLDDMVAVAETMTESLKTSRL
jgi:hypothetical protein